MARRTCGVLADRTGSGPRPAAPLLPGAPAGAVTETFTEPGADAFTVPTGICSVAITADGGRGGGIGETAGGVAAGVGGRITVAPGLTLDIFVGEEGGGAGVGDGGAGGLLCAEGGNGQTNGSAGGDGGGGIGFGGGGAGASR